MQQLGYRWLQDNLYVLSFMSVSSGVGSRILCPHTAHISPESSTFGRDFPEAVYCREIRSELTRSVGTSLSADITCKPSCEPHVITYFTVVSQFDNYPCTSHDFKMSTYIHCKINMAGTSNILLAGRQLVPLHFLTNSPPHY